MRKATFRKWHYGLSRNLLCSIFLFIVFILIMHYDYGGLYSGNSEIISRKLSNVREDLNYLKHLNKEEQKAFLDLLSRYKTLLPRTNLSSRFGNASSPLYAYNRTRHDNYILTNRTTRHRLFVNPVDIGELSLTGIYDFLPHLLRHPEALTPALKLSSDRKTPNSEKTWLTIGVPTIKRDKISYLMTTLRSLIDNMDQTQERTIRRGRVTIVVFIGEPGATDYAQLQINELRTEFGAQLDAGLLEVVVPHESFYPADIDSIPSTFNDSPERMKWRTKQNLDYIYMMMYCQNKATFYMQLEDDVITKPGYIQVIEDFIAKQDDSWYSLQFSSLGFIGKLFRSRDLPQIIGFIAIFHRDKPVDWLLAEIFRVRYCDPEKAQKDCAAAQNRHRIIRKPSLFQHIGVRSSLSGKMQKLKEKDFGKQLLHKAHSDNPPASVSTSLKVYQKYTLESAYHGHSFFWGLLPQAGDWIKFEFTPPLQLDGFTFRSGNAEHPDDMFYNTSVEVMFQTPYSSPKEVDYLLTEDGFFIVTWFSSTGLAQAVINSTSPVSTVRLVVHSESSNWVMLSEIWFRAAVARPL